MGKQGQGVDSMALDQELIGKFVGNAHGNFDAVKQMLAENPELLNAVWDQFDETAIQAATQTGQREIVEYLLAQGAPMAINAAALSCDEAKVSEFLKQDAT